MPKMILMFFLLLSALLYPSGYNLKILMNSGSSQVFAVVDIQKITKDVTLNIQLKSGNVQQFDVAQISKIVFDTAGSTGIGIEVPDIVKTFALLQNYPNPFNPSTIIEYQLPNTGLVHIKIYDVAGSEVKSLLSETQNTGTHKIAWQGDNNAGQKVPSGMYVYNVMHNNSTISKKMLLIK